MIKCTFHLNGGQLSTLSCPGIGFFPAYSGYEGLNGNNPSSVSIAELGPLPPGRYFIVSRPTGGIRTMIQDWATSKYSGSDRSIWFALYKDDNNIDDWTFIGNVERGHFRLHPAGYRGISEGCITLASPSHYAILRDALLKTPMMPISATLTAYGTVQVY